LLQADGKVLIGGEFTSYNGTTANHIARLNTDGSLDTTFNSSNIITGPVYAMAMSPTAPLNFSHASNGTTNEDDQVVNLGQQTSGTVSVTYNMTVGPDQMQVYYGDTNVAREPEYCCLTRVPLPVQATWFCLLVRPVALPPTSSPWS